MGTSGDHNAVLRLIGSNIRRLRKEKGPSQDQLANMIGMDRPYLSLIECGKKNMSVNILVKIADGLDVPLTELFSGLDRCAPHKLPGNTAYALVKLPEDKRAEQS